MRLVSAVTGARHLWLTDDSGVGNAHAEPKVQCYQVTRLDALIRRILKSELTGQRVEATQGEVVREVGHQQAGVCIVDLTTTTPPTTQLSGGDKGDSGAGSTDAVSSSSASARSAGGEMYSSSASAASMAFRFLLVLWCALRVSL